MKTPRTSYPSRSSSAAATELSTPPLIATTTFFAALRPSQDHYLTARGDVQSRTVKRLSREWRSRQVQTASNFAPDESR